MGKYQLVALVIIAIFYIAYLVKSLSLTLKGIKVNQLGHGKKPTSTKVVEKILKVVSFLMVAIQLCSVFSLLPLQIKTPEVLQIIGLSLSAIGTIFFITAMLSMGKNWRAGIAAEDSTNFVKHGIYRISRNPAFCGFDLIYIGTLLVFPSVIHVIAVVLTIIFFHLQILEEEKFMESAFGTEYQNYKQKVGRYFLFF